MWNPFRTKTEPTEVKSEEEFTGAPENSVYTTSRLDTTYNPIIDDVFDGEKTAGELGTIHNTQPDHVKLRLRAYDMNLKTDLIQIITNKVFKWVIGSGLKLSAEPNKKVLDIYGYKDDLDAFKENNDALFNQYMKQEEGDFHKNGDIHERAMDAFSTSFLGGDTLCIMRFEKDGPNIQVIDGVDVSDPLDDTGKEEGNTIIKGIEIDERGHHVAFWVHVASSHGDDADFEHERVESHNKYGLKTAWMVYGKKNRIGDYRGIPSITSILEKVTKLDRFIESSVSKAEKVADLVYAFEHDLNGTGENVLNNNLTGKKSNVRSAEESYIKAGHTASQLRQSTSGQVLNLTPGSKLSALSTEADTTFNEFFRAVFVTLCAAVDIPEEVALQKYDSNYSASRAAINGWEYVINIYREKFSKNFYVPLYRGWLFQQAFKGEIPLDGFKKALKDGKKPAINAYYGCRFTGKKMPHIDPLKEARAVREMLGDKNIPLSSLDQASEALNLGEWAENYKKYSIEYAMVDDDHKMSESDKQKYSITTSSSEPKRPTFPEVDDTKKKKRKKRKKQKK